MERKIQIKEHIDLEGENKHLAPTKEQTLKGMHGGEQTYVGK